MKSRSGKVEDSEATKHKPKEVLLGTLRVKTADLQLYEKTKKSWRKYPFQSADISLVIDLFRANNNFDVLIDKNDPIFLKGQLSPEGVPQGARIKVLPNGKELNKAFSLFAPKLTIHDESSHHHWNVIYENKGGTFSYIYTIEKKNKFITRKYKVVKDFGACYRKLERNTYKALNDKNDHLAVPMYTLLKTLMRVGNDTYYKINHHQGLRTLKKSNISIKEDRVLFDYIGKDGVPTSIASTFPSIYIARLKELLRTKGDDEFVFVNKDTGKSIQDNHFKDAFKRYCGKEFYPHIVRSYYATLKAMEFLKTCKNPTKEDVQKLFFSIAERLGHKRFIKNDGVWKDSYAVTVNHYIQPSLVKKIKAAIVNNKSTKQQRQTLRTENS